MPRQLTQFELLLLVCLPFSLLSGCATFQTPASDSQVQKQNADHETYFGMARIAERNGKIEQARKAYSRILEESPSHFDSLHRMAVTSVMIDRMDEAIQYFEKALDTGVESAELLTDLGYAFHLSEEFESAERMFEKALALKPNDERTINNLAITFGKQGKYDKAYSLFCETVEPAEALANLAYVQTQAGDMEFAAQNYHRALELNPKLEIAANGLYQVHQAYEQPTNTPRNQPPMESWAPEQLVQKQSTQFVNDRTSTKTNHLIASVSQPFPSLTRTSAQTFTQTSAQRATEGDRFRTVSVSDPEVLRSAARVVSPVHFDASPQKATPPTVNPEPPPAPVAIKNLLRDGKKEPPSKTEKDEPASKPKPSAKLDRIFGSKSG